jgi:mRNA-degrading endonuclease YafQ of YafQ-DinJ toxin-antitoxin module
MNIEKSKDYERSFKRIIKRHILTKEIIESAIELFSTDSSNHINQKE